MGEEEGEGGGGREGGQEDHPKIESAREKGEEEEWEEEKEEKEWGGEENKSEKEGEGKEDEDTNPEQWEEAMQTEGPEAEIVSPEQKSRNEELQRRYDIRIVSFNSAGLREKEKLKPLAAASRKFTPGVICIQEIHGLSEEALYNLQSMFPKYRWFINWGSAHTCGVAIGVRNCMSIAQPIERPWNNGEGTSIAVDINLDGRAFRIMNTYKPNRADFFKTFTEAMEHMQTTKEKVWTGDFNLDLEEEPFNKVINRMSELNMSRLEWSKPTHYQERCIDHIFISESTPEDRRAIVGIPTPYKDHLIMAGGAIGRSIDTSSHTRRIPDFICKDPTFYKEVLKRAGKYSEGPSPFLKRFKECAWEEWERIRSGEDNDWKHERLCSLQHLLRSLSQVNVLPKVTGRTSNMQLEAMTEAVRRFQIKKRLGWRKIILPRVLQVCREWIEYWEEQLGIPSERRHSNKGKRKTARIKGVLVREGIVVRDKNEANRRITKFWSNLFGSVREYDPELLERMITEHEARFPTVDKLIINKVEVLKLLRRGNKSCAGPDGVPFALYRVTGGALAQMWVDLIQEAGEDTKWDSNFFLSQLCLLPKVDTGFPSVDQFRPITITNADYRIVMRYWAVWLAGLANVMVSRDQHALLPGRLIDDAIELIHDGFMEAVAEEDDVTLLQTDFYKAFDFVNRAALIQILEGLNAPPQIVCLAKKILGDSELVMPNMGGEPKGDTNSITCRTGVRQGCPISPLLFVLVFEILLGKLKECNKIRMIEAYMDDLALILKKGAGLEAVSEVFEEYGRATGAKLNYKKCFFLTSNREFEPPTAWAEMEEENYRGWETTYLGVPLSMKIDPMKDWSKVLSKMSAAAARIKSLSLKGAAKIRAINTYVIPIMGYLGRFKIMNEAVAKRMWRTIRSALGSHAHAPVGVLTGKAAPFDQSPKLRHPILFNWALLNARSCKNEDPINPNSIAEARKEANQAISNLVGKPHEKNHSANRSYQRMAAKIGPKEADIVQGLGVKMEAVIYNLSHRLPGSTKRCLSQLITKRWATNDRLGRINNTDNSCRLCGEEKETLNHIFRKCRKVAPALDQMSAICKDEGIKGWNRGDSLLGLGDQMLSMRETAARAIALEVIRDALAGRNPGLLGKDRAGGEYRARMKKSKTIGSKQGKEGSSPPKEDHPPPEATECRAWYDGSGREDPNQGGAGYWLEHNGKEVACGTATIPFGTNNVGEFWGALKALKRAKEWTRTIQIIGDCEILTRAMNKGTPVNDPALDEILREIRKEVEGFDTVEFHHVSRKYNKRADQLATAASISGEAGRRAVGDKDWDPRAAKDDSTNLIELTKRSQRLKRLMAPSLIQDAFPVISGRRPKSKSKNTITSNWRSFPSLKPNMVGTIMRKTDRCTNMRSFAINNPVPHTVQEHEWDILRGMRSFATTMGVVKWNITNPSPGSNASRMEWTTKVGAGKNKGRRSGVSVEVVSTGVTTGMTNSPMYMKHRKGRKGRGEGEWKEKVTPLRVTIDDSEEEPVSSEETASSATSECTSSEDDWAAKGWSDEESIEMENEDAEESAEEESGEQDRENEPEAREEEEGNPEEGEEDSEAPEEEDSDSGESTEEEDGKWAKRNTKGQAAMKDFINMKGKKIHKQVGKREGRGRKKKAEKSKGGKKRKEVGTNENGKKVVEEGIAKWFLSPGPSGTGL
jgi:ribonuclease HI